MKTPFYILLMLGALGLNGCAAALIGGGYVAGEELSEDDGDFDPLDEIVDGK